MFQTQLGESSLSLREFVIERARTQKRSRVSIYFIIMGPGIDRPWDSNPSHNYFKTNAAFILQKGLPKCQLRSCKIHYSFDFCLKSAMV